MIKVNIHEAKARLSQYIDAVGRGESVVICRRNVPVAELRALPTTGRSERRPWGDDRGAFVVPADFNEPLSEAELALWEGGER